MRKDVINAAILSAFAVIASTMLAGCELAKGIFKAGAWVGVIAVVLAFALIAGLVSMARKA